VTKHRIELPPFAETYLREQPRRQSHERVVVMFHRWLFRKGRQLNAVTAKEVHDFAAAPTGRAVGQMTRNDYRYKVRRYLRWLEKRGLAGPFGAEDLDGYYRKPLPDEVRRFLQFLAPTRRPSTINGYRYVLRRFHRWLGDQNIAITNLDHSVCLAWSQELHERGLHPTTRFCWLVNLRTYLDWLWEHSLIAAPGRALILSRDLPKKPDYLPRPLPPEIDQELQTRLKQSGTTVTLGLFVMRRTGLRVGELRRLERECVRADESGKSFLKVPLGKMNNERLVPLDDATLAAVTELQRRGRQDHPYLVQGARGRPIVTTTYQSTLTKIGGDLPLSERLTTHRLRHSFATSLMNGGMSLLGIMKLLGHRDFRMTLRYTQIVDETVGREYFEALSRVAARYELPRGDLADIVDLDAVALIQSVISWTTKNLCKEGPSGHTARLLARRLEHARDDLKELCSMAPTSVR
jgi:site-specific recombinase XerD